MSRAWSLGGGVATVASIAVAVLASRPSPSPASPAPRLLNSTIEAPRFLPKGAGSCAASACHGGDAAMAPPASNVLRNEHTTWITSDPHALAFEILSNERSERIERNLGKATNSFISAANDARCLACHALPTAENAGPDLADTIRRDGVSCESCHGDSSAWIGEHTRFDWMGLDRTAKSQSFNFTNLRDLNTRAQTCAGCHVGAPADPSRGVPARDVNHDLIAAGHPRLNWEFSAYVANYPKHWIQKEKTPDWDAKLWKIGQAATLRASADLLASRADQASQKKAPWPELSEYGCFSCHFGLKETPFRGNRDPNTPLGTPQWASWNLPMAEMLAKTDPTANGVDAKIANLRKTMGNLVADPAIVRSEAEALRASLDGWLATPNAFVFDPNGMNTIINTLNARDANGKRTLARNWDSAAQIYLGLAAAHASIGQFGGNDPALRSELATLLKELGFEKGFDSPRDFGTGDRK